LQEGAPGEVLSMLGPALMPASFFCLETRIGSRMEYIGMPKNRVIDGVKADMPPSRSQPHHGNMARER